MTADPLAYLHAAHAEAQTEAEAAAEPEGWVELNRQSRPTWYVQHWADPDVTAIVADPESSAYPVVVTVQGMEQADADARAAHIAHHDPAAVLRRITAERKLVASHQPVHDRTGWNNGTYDDIDPACSTCGSDDNATPFPCQTIRALAEAWGWTSTP